MNQPWPRGPLRPAKFVRPRKRVRSSWLAGLGFEGLRLGSIGSGARCTGRTDARLGLEMSFGQKPSGPIGLASPESSEQVVRGALDVARLRRRVRLGSEYAAAPHGPATMDIPGAAFE
jgi:hypothetical protein